MSTMKNCPFCGLPGSVLHWPELGYLPLCVDGKDCGGMIEKWFSTEEEAIEKWNRRDDSGDSGEIEK